MEQVLVFLITPAVYVPTAALAFMSYFVNRFILKVKKEYSGFNLKMALMLSVFPGINMVFLFLNTLIFSMVAGKWRVVKVKKYHKSRVAKKKEGYSLGRI